MKKTTKILKKISGLILTLLLGVNFVSAATAPATLEISHTDYKNPPVSFPSTFHVSKTTNGKYIYCIDYVKKTPVSSIKYTKSSEIKDSGALYILEKGNNATSDEDYFVAQTALWIYLMDTDDMHAYDNIKKFKADIKSSTNSYATKINNLVSTAKKQKDYDSSKPTISLTANEVKFTLSSDGKYYISNAITVDSSKKDYKVTLENTPEGTTYTNKNNTIIIKVPTAAVNDSKTTFKVKVTNTKEYLKAYKYKPNNNNYQEMAYAIPEKQSASDSLEMSIAKTKVSISKQDATTKNELPGAKLEVKDESGNVIDSWTSSSTPHIITDIKPGKYTLTETTAPEGYILSTESISFEVTDSGVTEKVVMYNTKETPHEEVVVPPTGKSKNILSSMIGLIVIASGSVLITKNIKKKNEL